MSCREPSPLPRVLGREAGNFRGFAAVGGRVRRLRERQILPGVYGREAGHFRGLAAVGGRVLCPRERMQNAPGEL